MPTRNQLPSCCSALVFMQKSQSQDYGMSLILNPDTAQNFIRQYMSKINLSRLRTSSPTSAIIRPSLSK